MSAASIWTAPGPPQSTRRQGCRRSQRFSPPNLPTLVLFLQIFQERLEVFEHWPAAELFARRFADHRAPITGRARFHDVVKERSDFLVAGDTAIARVLMQNLLRDVHVELI